MIIYILKSSLCLLLLWAFYRLFLEKENVHFLKRFYLLFSLVFACVLPLITITYEVEVSAKPQESIETIASLSLPVEDIPTQQSTNYIPMIVWSLYVIGVLVFGFRFILNIIDISKKIRKNERFREISHINVLLSNAVVPHTFLDYIFVPKKEFQQKSIPEEVLLHEKTHVLQKHTLDILFVEVLQVIFWFNPLFNLIKRSIKLNHEFLADQHVLKQQFSIHNYVDLLLNYPNSPNQAVLSSPINYSLTKKRLQMMTQEFSKKRVALKLAAIVPIVLLCVLFFTQEIIAKEVEKPVPEMMASKAPFKEPIKDSPMPIIVAKSKKGGVEKQAVVEAVIQDGVTPEMAQEYNNWAKDLNSKIKGNKQITIRKNELDRMEYIYKNMTTDQRKSAEKFPDIDMPPPPPPAPIAPKVEKSNIPPPPPPRKTQKSKAPKSFSKKVQKIQTDDGYAEILLSEEEDWTEEEKRILEENVREQLAEEGVDIKIEKTDIEKEKALLQQFAQVKAHIERERALLQEEFAQVNAQRLEEHRRHAAELAMEESEVVKEAAERAREAMEIALMNRKISKNAQASAMEEAHQQKRAMRLAEEQALKARLEARKAMHNARRQARKAEIKVRKAEIKARKKAMEAEMKARKAEHKALQMERHYTADEIIKSMAKKDAEFYHNGKQISAKKALKLIEKSDNKVSIDASTKNGQSTVILKD